MTIFLDDTKCREALFPFTLTRHVSEIRVGILTIKQKWEKLTGATVCTSGNHISPDLTINANILPTPENVDVILKAASGKITVMESEIIRILNHPWQIFQLNDWALRADYDLLTRNRSSAELSSTVTAINKKDIFLEAGASIEYSILNATKGPIYVGKGAQILEGNLVQVPFSLGDNSLLKMGGKMYGATSIGPDCVAAGEIKNSVMFGYSNKAHDGYLGDSVIGEFCNLGAGTSNSNLKNTAGPVKYFLNNNMELISAGNKGGLLMGDYSRAAVNTTFNTGAVVGVCCNIFGDVSSRKYINDFSWGNDRYIFDRAMNDINEWKKLKQQEITPGEIENLRKLYDKS